MRLSSLRIENFRSFEDQTIPFDNYTCFVGLNGSGKSTVLIALNIFFRNTGSSATDLLNLSEEDFHLKDTSRPIKITLTFDHLSEDAKAALKAYVRHDQLVVSAIAEFDPVTQRAPVRQVGSRLVMGRFKDYFRAEENRARAAELKQIYEVIRKDFPALPAPGSMDAMRVALRAFEEQHPELCELIEGETQFYGWTKGENLLRQFMQWEHLPAVKDPTSEQDEGRATTLGAILERTIRSKVSFEQPLTELRKDATARYQDILKKEQGVLDVLTESLTKKLRLWAHESTNVTLKWHFNDQNSIKVAEPLVRIFAGEHDFLGELGRLGHGLQRSLLVVLLQELSETGDSGPENLLLGLEEPELYQHPPQARHMSSILEALSEKHTQVIVTTHSPYFVSARGFPFIRMVRSSLSKKASVVSRYTHEQLAESLAKALNNAARSPTETMAAVEQIMQPSQNELFFTRIGVLVEGPEDVAFFSTYMNLLSSWPEFRRLGCHFIVASGKPNLSRPLAIARGLGIPAFAVFDADNGDQADANKQNNRCLFELCGINDADLLPKDIVWRQNLIAWPNTIKHTICADVGEDKWNATDSVVRAKFGYEGINQKNQMVIAAILQELWNQGIKSGVLTRACEVVLEFARKAA
jgi:predicted ATP-dependent endonuclease of OLD family